MLIYWPTRRKPSNLPKNLILSEHGRRFRRKYIKMAKFTLKPNKFIENRIREGIRNGVTIKVLLDSIQHMQDAPKSTETLYRHYGQAIAEERAELHGYIGGKIREKIEEGDSSVLIFAARSKAGWNPQVEVKEVDSDDPDENLDAVATLAQMLGKNQKDEPDQSPDNSE